MNTGDILAGRPSLGAWVTYGIGSEASDLPGFVVLQSGPRGPRGGAVNWGSGFLPTTYQGVKFRSVGDPVLYLSNPPGLSSSARRRMLDDLSQLDALNHDSVGDPEILTRIAQYELAYRMQTSAEQAQAPNNCVTLASMGAGPTARARLSYFMAPMDTWSSSSA